MHWSRFFWAFYVADFPVELLIFVTLGIVMKTSICKIMKINVSWLEQSTTFYVILWHIMAGKTMPSLPYDYLLNDALAGGVGGGWWVGSRANKANEGWDRVGRSERQIGRWQPGQSCLFSTLLFTFLMITREWWKPMVKTPFASFWFPKVGWQWEEKFVRGGFVFRFVQAQLHEWRGFD